MPEGPPSTPDDMPEPYGALMAFLADLHDQVAAFEQGAELPGPCGQITERVREHIAGMGVLVQMVASIAARGRPGQT